WDTVGADRSVCAGNLKLAEILELASSDVQPVDGMAILVVGPDLPVHVRICRAHHRLLRAIALPFLRYGIDLELLGLAVELCDASLVHQRDPQVLFLIELQIERAHRKAFLQHGNGKLRDLSGIRINPTDELLAKI